MNTKESLYSSFPVPTRLFDDFHDTPLTIGIYSLVARLYLVHKDAIALSSGDIQRYDTTLSRGAVLRALDRLVRGGWLIEYREKRGCKIRYVPAWGLVNGEPRPWQTGAPGLNRPSHVRTLRLSKDVLDVCIGRLAPHQTGAALVTRYTNAPEIGLTDVGCYALTLFGKPTPTDALLRCGLVRDGQAQPVPNRLLVPNDTPSHTTPNGPENESAEDVVQRNDVAKPTPTTQTLCTTETDEHATGDAVSMKERRSGGEEDGSSLVLSSRLLLRPDMIGNMIILVLIYMITWMIARMGLGTYAYYARERHKRLFFSRATATKGNPAKQEEKGKVLNPADQTAQPNIGKDGDSCKQTQRPDKSATTEKPVATHTNHSTKAVACVLRDIGVHPGSISLLAHMPLDLVQDIIARGQARSDIHDLAAWVVAALRAEQQRLEQIVQVEPLVQPVQPAPTHQLTQHEHQSTSDTIAPPAYVSTRDSTAQHGRNRRPERHRGQGQAPSDIDIWAAILSFGPATREHTKPPTDTTLANSQKDHAPENHPNHPADSVPAAGSTNDRERSSPSVPSDDTQPSVSQDELPQTATEAGMDVCGAIQVSLDARQYYMARYHLKQAVRSGNISHEVQQNFEQALDQLKHELEQERLAAARASRQRQRLRHGGMDRLSRVGHVPVGQSSPDRFKRTECEVV